MTTLPPRASVGPGTPATLVPHVLRDHARSPERRCQRCRLFEGAFTHRAVGFSSSVSSGSDHQQAALSARVRAATDCRAGAALPTSSQRLLPTWRQWSHRSGHRACSSRRSGAAGPNHRLWVPGASGASRSTSALRRFGSGSVTLLMAARRVDDNVVLRRSASVADPGFGNLGDGHSGDQRAPPIALPGTGSQYEERCGRTLSSTGTMISDLPTHRTETPPNERAALPFLSAFAIHPDTAANPGSTSQTTVSI